jgi:GntR family transcriptional regulator
MAASGLSTRPLYIQLRDAMVERITSGTWRPGSITPNETDLAREFGVSAGTVRKALDLMEAERLVIRRQGRGTFVNEQTVPDLASRFCAIRNPDGTPNALSSAIGPCETIEAVPPNEGERERLQLRTSDRVYRFQRLQMEADTPVLVENVAVPAALFPDLPRHISLPETVFELALRSGLLLSNAQERVSIEAAPDSVASILGVNAGTPLFVLDRVIRTLEGRTVEWRIGFCNIADNCYVAHMH